GGERLVAEWGGDLGRFGTAARWAAGRGSAPGHDARAGQPRAGKPRTGTQAWRTGRTPWAQAAAPTHGTSRSARDQRLAPRRGKKRALSAVAPAIVVSAFPRRAPGILSGVGGP